MSIGVSSVVSAALLVLLISGETAIAESARTVNGCVRFDPGNYAIVPGDILFFGNGNVIKRIVPADGKVFMPLTGEVQVLEQTPEHLAQVVRERLTKYRNNRDVQLHIEFDGMNPCEFDEPAPTTVMQALDQIGVIRKLASPYKNRRSRSPQILRFNYKEAREGKDPEQDIIIEKIDNVFTTG
jgi:hypothetical protein